MNESLSQKPSVLSGLELGIGTWAWGDRLYWGYGKGYTDEDILAGFQVCIDAGIRLFDTAEIYGQGRSETLLGQFIKESAAEVLVATKFAPLPWRLNRRALLRALRGSLGRLGLPAVDLYQIHWSSPPINIETWMEAMVEAAQAGWVRAVGVSNYDRRQMQRAYDILVREGLSLASNQVEYNLINRKIEKNGLLKHCQDLGISVIAYSPMAMGLLTGKYTQENPPKGMRTNHYGKRLLGRVQPLIKLLNQIGGDHGGKNAAQVSINWVICKGCIAIPGIKTAAQAGQNTGAIGWRLTDEEMARLDEASDRILLENEKLA